MTWSSTEEEIVLFFFFHDQCNENDNIEWSCTKCLFQVLPFCNCSAKVFKSLTEAPKTNSQKTKLNSSYFNQFFSPNQCFDNRNQGNYPNQFSDNLDPLTLQDNKYIDSQNMSVLMENIKSKSTLIVMLLNIRSFCLNFDKLKF